MNYATFLSRIHAPERLAVGPHFDLATDGLPQALQQLDEMVRIDGPTELPDYDPAAGAWGVARLHAACVLLAHRDLDAAAIEQHLSVACPHSLQEPATHYSVDLAMRHLPDLWRLARSSSMVPPLAKALRRLAASWPLSSVGIEQLGPVEDSPLLANAGLRRMYVERILRRQDRERTQNPAVPAAVEVGINEHRDFARSVLAVHDQLIRHK